jgi:hypothetical protein
MEDRDRRLALASQALTIAKANAHNAFVSITGAAWAEYQASIDIPARTYRDTCRTAAETYDARTGEAWDLYHQRAKEAQRAYETACAALAQGVRR